MSICFSLPLLSSRFPFVRPHRTPAPSPFLLAIAVLPSSPVRRVFIARFPEVFVFAKVQNFCSSQYENADYFLLKIKGSRASSRKPLRVRKLPRFVPLKLYRPTPNRLIVNDISRFYHRLFLWNCLLGIYLRPPPCCSFEYNGVPVCLDLLLFSRICSKSCAVMSSLTRIPGDVRSP